MSDHYTIDCLAGRAPVLNAPNSGSVSGTALTAGSSSTPTTLPLAEASPESFRFSQYDNVYRRSHFESTEPDSMDEDRWTRAVVEMPINDTLDEQLSTMRARASYEAENSSTLEGLKLSHTLAVFGERGPQLDLQAETESGDRWADQAEQLWERWCEHCDASSAEGTFASKLKRANFGCWDEGEWLWQFVDEDPQFSVPDVPNLRIKDVEVQRLRTPLNAIGDTQVILGIRRNKHGRPTEYWIDDEWLWSHGEGRWVPHDLICHGYDRVQARCGQARGIPWSQWGLPVSASTRDLDGNVLDAARVAAKAPIIAYTRHPDAEYTDSVPTYVKYRGASINFLAPGWEAQQNTPAQPGPHYKDHRQELHGDMGKPKGVPSMITRLDARDHNYSSARFDYLLLGQSAGHVRATMYTPCVRRVFAMVISDAILRGIIGPPPSRRANAVRLELVWPVPREVDEGKAATAETQYLANGTETYTSICASRHGSRARDVIRRRARDNRMLEQYGLPPVGTVPASNQPQATNDQSGDSDDTDEADQTDDE